jgi:hypothetical protein
VVGLSVVANDRGVDKKSQKGKLVGNVIVLQQRGCVEVAALCIRKFSKRSAIYLPD